MDDNIYMLGKSHLEGHCRVHTFVIEIFFFEFSVDIQYGGGEDAYGDQDSSQSILYCTSASSESPQPLSYIHLPYEYFKRFLSKDLLEYTVNETNLYSIQDNPTKPN